MAAFVNCSLSRTITRSRAPENRLFHPRADRSPIANQGVPCGTSSIVEVNQIRETITALQSRLDALRGYL